MNSYIASAQKRVWGCFWFLHLYFVFPLAALCQPAQQIQLPQDALNEGLRRAQSQVSFTRTPPQLLPAVLPAGYLLDHQDILLADLQSPRIAQTHELRVNETGNVRIPRLGIFRARGMTQEVLQKSILTRARKLYNAKDLQVSLFLKQPRQINVTVTGQVNRPGSYRLPQGTALLQGIRSAGGVQDTATVFRVELRREGTSTPINLLRFYRQGEPHENPVLKAGDQIHVPVMPYRVMAFGAVQNPGIYEVAGSMSIAELLKKTGGLRPDSGEYVRWTGLLSAGLQEQSSLKSSGFLMPSESLYVPSKKLVSQNATVLLQGLIRQPGSQNWQQGMRLLDALYQAGGAQPNADLGQVHISRLNPVTGQRQLLRLQVSAYLEGKLSDSEQGNPLLMAGDIVTFPENFFNIRNISEFTTLLLSTLGVISVVVNFSRGTP